MNTCLAKGCERPTKARGMCSVHYNRWYKANAPDCSVEGCETAIHAWGMCQKHYNRARANRLGKTETTRRDNTPPPDPWKEPRPTPVVLPDPWKEPRPTPVVLRDGPAVVVPTRLALLVFAWFIVGLLLGVVIGVVVA